MSLALGKSGRILISWGVLTVAGIYAFVLSKNSVEKQRYESMQVRDRMRKANTGEYEAIGTRRFQSIPRTAHE